MRKFKHNEECRTEAENCKTAGDYFEAMRWFNSASAATLGHGKTESYQRLAKECAEIGGFKYDRWNFAD